MPTLTIAGRRVVYLEKEFQQISETGLVGIEHDLDRFGVRAVIPIGGVLDVAARIAHPGGTAGLVVACPKQPPAKIARSVLPAIVTSPLLKTT